MGFNKDQFVAQNRKNVEENPFGEIDNGYYICELVDAQFCYSKGKGLYQALFQWKIDPDNNDRHKGQNIFVNVGLENDDKTERPEGYKVLDIVLSTLGVNDRSVFADDPDGSISKVIGTRARMEVKEENGYKRNRVNRLIKNAWKENQNNILSQNVQTQVATNSNAPNYDNAPFTNSHGVKIENQAKVTVRLANGQALGTILSTVPESKQALIQFDNTEIPTALHAYEDLYILNSATISEGTPQPLGTTTATIETIEVLEQPQQSTKVKLEVGMNVQGRFGDTHVSGVVHRIDEAAGNVIIASGGKGYPCPVDTVQLIQ